MKTLFIHDNVVVGLIVTDDSNLYAISTSHPEAERMEVGDSNPVDQDWLVTREESGAISFAPPPPKKRQQLSRVEFKILFTKAERLAINSARTYSGKDQNKSDLKIALNDFYEIIEDPDLKIIDLTEDFVREGFETLVSGRLITKERAEAMLTGVVA